MSQSDEPTKRTAEISGLEIVCVFLVPFLWASLIQVILKSSSFFLWIYGEAALKPEPLMLSRQMLWVGAISAPFQVVSALAFLSSGAGFSFAEVGLTTRNLWRNVFAGLVFAVIFVPGSYGIQTLSLAALEAVGSKPQDHPFTQLGSTGLLPVEWVLLIFGAVVAAPIWEEFVYRGLIQPWVLANGRPGGLVVLGLAMVLAVYAALTVWIPSPTVGEIAVTLAPVWILALLVGVYFLVERRNAEWGGLFASAVLFAWIHVGVWPSPVPLVWLALGLGWLARRGRSLAGAIVLHAVFNAVACAALLYGPRDTDREKPTVPPASLTTPGDPP